MYLIQGFIIFKKIFDISVSSKLKISFLIVTSLSILLGVFSFIYLSQLSSLTEKMYNHPFTVSNTVRDINSKVISMHRSMKDVALSNNILELDQAIKKVDNLEQSVIKDYELVFERFLGDESSVREKYNSFLQWKEIRDEVIRLVKAGDKEKAAEITKQKGALYVEKLNNEMKSLILFANNKAKHFLDNTEKEKEKALLFLIGLVSIIFLISVYISKQIIQSIIHPIQILSKGLNEFFLVLQGKRKTYEPITYNANDEFRNMIFSVNENIKLTTKLHAEIAQQQQEQDRLVKLLDRHVIFSKTDTKGIITHASEAFCKISGYSRDELIGKTHNIVRHPDTPKETFETLWKSLKEEIPINSEMKNRKKNGDFYWLDGRFEPDYSDGKLIGYAALRVDITDKKEVQELSKNLEIKVEQRTQEIEEQQQQFTSMVSNVPGAIYRVIDDSAWPIIYMSDEIENITGYPSKDFTDSKIQTFSTIMYPDDVVPIGQSIQEQFTKGKSFQVDYRIISKSGEIKWVRSQGQFLKSEDGEAFIDGILIDITKAKEGEVKIELLTELVYGSLKSASVGAWWVDFTEEDTFHALKNTSEMIGIDFKSEDSDALVISEWVKVLQETATLSDDYKKAIDDTFENFTGAISGKYEYYHAVYPISYSNGEVKWIEARANVPKRDENGTALLMTGTLIDITDIRNTQEELEQIHKNTRESIEYASLIQSALIPDNQLMSSYFSDYLTIWQPKDIVGGDIYLFEELRDKSECLLLVIDCTGHGVPGAFVTMLVKAIERQVVSKIENDKSIDVSPAWILSYFNKTMKKLLQQESEESISNAGFDGGIIYYNKKEKLLKFAGAETPLFYIEDEELKTIKGNRHSIGYKKSDVSYEFKEHIINVKEGMKFYLTTDGYLDQNGGEKGFPLGKRRFSEVIKENSNKSFTDQKEILLDSLNDYQGNENRNDDITVVGFEIQDSSAHETIVEYNGVLTQGILAHTMEVIESKISNMTLMSKVSTTIIELAQNMMYYGKTEEIDSTNTTSEGFFEVTKDSQDIYHVRTKNIVSLKDKEKIESTLSEIESLDEADIKKRYRELRKSGENSHDKGGGIGFYEVAKLVKEIDYSFTKLDEERYLYEFKTQMSAKKKEDTKIESQRGN